MKKYAVGVCNLYTNENEVKIVTAENKIEAIVIAVEDENNIKFDTLKEALKYYYDGEISVSKPVVI